MKLNADTTVLRRAIVGDDPAQEQLATRALFDTEQIVVTLHVFCELDWVLRRL